MATAFRVVPAKAQWCQGQPEEPKTGGEQETPEVCVEALMYALRRGLSCLSDAGNRERLRHCDPEAMKRIAGRLLTLSERTAGCHESWAQADVAKLVAVWRAMRNVT